MQTLDLWASLDLVLLYHQHTQKVYPEVPPRVEYTLTETGYSLKPVLDAMVAWGTEYKQKKGQNPPQY